MTYGLLQSLVEADQNLLLYLNGFHNTFGDCFHWKVDMGTHVRKYTICIT